MAKVIEEAIRSTVTGGITGVARVSAALRSRAGDHPYLSGIHRPMSEELTLNELAVSGAIPPGLDGRYLRIGPNPITSPNPATHHWFLGDGMVHGIRLRAGRALWYRNRWIRSEAVSKVLDEAPVPTAPGRERGTVNTNVIGHAGRTWALVEAGTSPAQLDDELATIAFNPFEGTLKGPFSAHPHRDPDSGELHAVCYHGRVQDSVWHTVVDAQGRVVREQRIAVEHGPSIHDCAITKSFVLVFDLPVTFSMKALLGGYPFPYRWNPGHRARVGLLPRHGNDSSVRWYDVDPCYVFHPCNAWERADGAVIVDVVVHDRMFDQGYEGPDGSKIAFERWTLPAGAARIERRVVDDEAQEFPRFDERLTGKPYRFAYTMAAAVTGTGLINDTRLFRHDLEKHTRDVHDFGPGRHPGEFVFVPRSDGADEAEGWLIGLVVDTNDQTTDLAILDAAKFSAPPVATVRLPHRVPPGFHGNWVDAV